MKQRQKDYSYSFKEYLKIFFIYLPKLIGEILDCASSRNIIGL